MDFVKTVRGARFFDGSIPMFLELLGRLVVAMERIAKALEEKK